MKLGDVTILSVIKMLITKLSDEELRELKNDLSIREPHGFSGLSLGFVFSEAREKEDDPILKQYLTRCINYLFPYLERANYNPNKMTIEEFFEIPDAYILRCEHIGKKSIIAIKTYLKEKFLDVENDK